jgi:hypothetical protein
MWPIQRTVTASLRRYMRMSWGKQITSRASALMISIGACGNQRGGDCGQYSAVWQLDHRLRETNTGRFHPMFIAVKFVVRDVYSGRGERTDRVRLCDQSHGPLRLLFNELPQRDRFLLRQFECNGSLLQRTHTDPDDVATTFPFHHIHFAAVQQFDRPHRSDWWSNCRNRRGIGSGFCAVGSVGDSCFLLLPQTSE